VASSTGKTIGLILVAVILIFFFWRAVPFFLTPLGVFPHVFQWVKMPRMNGIEFGPFGGFYLHPLSIVSLAILIIWIFVIVWVYKDAEKRGMNGMLWALLVFIGNLIGLLIYLIVRSDSVPETKEVRAPTPCPNCGEPVARHFIYCANCGTRLQSICPKCNKPVEKSWQVCPHCGEKLNP